MRSACALRIPDASRVAACLDANVANLSPACRGAFAWRGARAEATHHHHRHYARRLFRRRSPGAQRVIGVRGEELVVIFDDRRDISGEFDRRRAQHLRVVGLDLPLLVLGRQVLTARSAVDFGARDRLNADIFSLSGSMPVNIQTILTAMNS